jgi:hypothetical protein
VAARPGASINVISTVEGCAIHPGTGQWALYGLAEVPTILAWCGVLLLLWRLIRSAGRAGPFAPAVATAMRQLGWFILAGRASPSPCCARPASTCSSTAALPRRVHLATGRPGRGPAHSASRPGQDGGTVGDDLGQLLINFRGVEPHGNDRVGAEQPGIVDHTVNGMAAAFLQ